MDGDGFGRLFAQSHFDPIYAIHGRVAGRGAPQRQHPAFRDKAQMHELDLNFLREFQGS